MNEKQAMSIIKNRMKDAGVQGTDLRAVKRDRETATTYMARYAFTFTNDEEEVYKIIGELMKLDIEGNDIRFIGTEFSNDMNQALVNLVKFEAEITIA